MQAIMTIWMDIMTTIFALPRGTENLLNGLINGISGFFANIGAFFDAIRDVINMFG